MTKFSFCLILSLLYGSAVKCQDTLSMTLEETIKLAVENNLSIKRSQIAVAGAHTDLKESKWARLPNANASASYSLSWGRSIDPFTNLPVTTRINAFRPTINSTVTLFNFFQQKNLIKSNETNLQASEWDVEKSKNDIQLNALTLYLNVLFNKERVHNANLQLEMSKEQKVRTQKLVDSGVLPLSNLLELTSQIATNEVNVINAQNDLSLAILNLKQLMQLKATDNITFKEPENISIEEKRVNLTTEDIFLAAASIMPEIKSSDLKVESAKLRLKSSIASRYPTLSLQGGLSTNYSSAARAFDPSKDNTEFVFGEQLKENLNRFVLLNISIPLFNGLSTQSNIQRNTLNVQQAEINALEQKNTLRQAIERAYFDAIASSKSYEAAKIQVNTLEQTLEMVTNQFNNGAINATDFLLAENNLFQAKSNLTRMKYDFLFKMKILDFYNGNTLY